MAAAARGGAERESLTNGRKAIPLDDYGATGGGDRKQPKRHDDDKVRILTDQDQVRKKAIGIFENVAIYRS